MIKNDLVYKEISSLSVSETSKKSVLTCIGRYSRPDGFSGTLAYLYQRIINAVKSLFGQSDWQLACKALGGSEEASVRLSKWINPKIVVTSTSFSPLKLDMDSTIQDASKNNPAKILKTSDSNASKTPPRKAVNNAVRIKKTNRQPYPYDYYELNSSSYLTEGAGWPYSQNK